MSVVLVTLPGAPGLNEEIIREDQELNQRIEKRLKEIVSTEDRVDLSEIIHIIDKEESTKLPGIVFYKYSLIEGMFNKVLNNASNKEDEPASMQDMTAVSQT